MLAKTRLQMHRKRVTKAEDDSQNSGEEDVSVVNIWQEVLKKDGVSGLYQGLEAQLLKGFVNQGVTMMVKQR